MEESAHEDLPRRLAPEGIGIGRRRGDQSARDPLRVPHVVEMVPDLEHRVVAGKPAASRRRPAEDPRAVGAPAIAARQLVDLLVGVQDDERPGVRERRGDDDASRLASARRREDKDVPVAPVPQVSAVDGSQDDALPELLGDPQILTLSHLVHAGKPRGAVGVARPRKPLPGHPQAPAGTSEMKQEDRASEFSR